MLEGIGSDSEEEYIFDSSEEGEHSGSIWGGADGQGSEESFRLRRSGPTYSSVG